MKEFSLKLALFFLVPLLISCASTTQYPEEFSTISVSPDSRRLAVLGKDYDYLFDMPSMLDKSLKSDFRQHLTATLLRDFYVSSNGETFGYFRLELDKEATEVDRERALKAGYQLSSTGLVYFTSIISGKRRPKGKGVIGAEIKLDRNYTVTVVDSEKSEQQMRALSPLYLTAGAGIAIATPAVLLFAAPMAELKP